VNRPYRAAAAFAGAAALTAAGLAPATAADWVRTDPVGDVQSLTFDENTVEEPELLPAPGNRNTDITEVVVRHRVNRVAVRLTLRNITGRSGLAVYDIRTDDRNYMAIKMLGKREGSMPGWLLMRANGRFVRCSDVRRHVDRPADEAVVRIPRRCLGFPQWVRVGVGVQSVGGDFDSFEVWLDDGLRDGDVQDVLTLSPRIQRG
jgi:hypothetical protein